MPTCKDCVHVDVCREYAKDNLTSLAMSPAEIQMALTAAENKPCDRFKDRSKFIELPCNIGQTVYAYCEDLHEILEYRIYCASVFRENSITYHADCYDEENDEALSEIGFEPDDIGEFVFFTREEVEQALKEREKE